MPFDYQTSTKGAYRQAEIAREYDASFRARLSWRSLRFRWVASGERRVIAAFLRRLTITRVLDLPCGTGKLAAVLAATGGEVHAADVSPEMLDVARQSYAAAGVTRAGFSICDAETVDRHFPRGRFDAVICLRLLHRVPPEIRARMLASLAHVGRHCIVSCAIDSSYHRWRRRVRSFLLRVPQQPICATPPAALAAEFAPYFFVRDQRWVSAAASEEKIFLLESRVLS